MEGSKGSNVLTHWFDRHTLAAVAVAACIFFSSIFMLGHKVDSLAREREEAQAGYAIRGAIQELAGHVPDIADWDEAVINLDNHFNRDWAAVEVGQYFCQTKGYDFAYVLDRNDEPVFGMRQKRLADSGDFQGLRQAAAPLIVQIRAEEIKRGPITGRFAPDDPLAKPIQASELAQIDGEVVILSVALVQPDIGLALPLGPRAPILITGKPLDAAFLKQFAQHLMLTNMRLAPVGEPNHDASIVLRDFTGAPIDKLVWTAERPGGYLVSAALLPILIGVGAPLGLYLHSRRTSQRLRVAMREAALARDAAAAAAVTDYLTQIYNRLHLDRALQAETIRAERYSHPFSLVLCDLDRFKELNDGYGHQAGDSVLVQTAALMRTQSRRNDTVGRFGGEEFMIILPDTDLKGAQAAAEKVRAAIEDACFGACGPRSASFGVAAWRPGDTPDTLLKRADAALYRAKALGRNRVETAEASEIPAPPLPARREGSVSPPMEIAKQPQSILFGSI